jgi:hypothetical protein
MHNRRVVQRSHCSQNNSKQNLHGLRLVAHSMVDAVSQKTRLTFLATSHNCRTPDMSPELAGRTHSVSLHLRQSVIRTAVWCRVIGHLHGKNKTDIPRNFTLLQNTRYVAIIGRKDPLGLPAPPSVGNPYCGLVQGDWAPPWLWRNMWDLRCHWRGYCLCTRHRFNDTLDGLIRFAENR